VKALVMALGTAMGTEKVWAQELALAWVKATVRLRVLGLTLGLEQVWVYRWELGLAVVKARGSALELAEE
jgi:hypothetical protein